MRLLSGFSISGGLRRYCAEITVKHVRRKAGLNREILKTGWSGLREKLAYKVSELVEVNPPSTSQTCHECSAVDAKNRRTQADFHCVHCGHRGNADHNAALNIMALGIGATGRRGALALATPMNRQKVCRLGFV